MFKLAIVAGHYLGTPGRRCLPELDPNETREWWLNDRIADKVEAKLANYEGIDILRLDDTSGLRDVPLADRWRAANEWHVDFYISFHHNGSGRVDEETGEPISFNGGGTVVYVSLDPSEEELEWQKELYDEIIAETGLKGNRATPLARRNLYEVTMTNMPAVLIECGFMDSTVDVPIILTDEFAEGVADAVVRVIVRKAGLTKKPEAVEGKVYGKATVTLPILGRGSLGAEVKTLQTLLNAHGCTDSKGQPLTVDGSFGPATQYALATFQSDRYLKADGFCGPATWAEVLKTE